MKPNSMFVATFIEGEKNYEGDKWVYPKCVTYTQERMACLAKEFGLICKPIGWPHHNQQKWILIYYPNYKEVPTTFFGLLSNKELEFCSQRLNKLLNHPYVKIGLMIKQCLEKIKSF